MSETDPRGEVDIALAHGWMLLGDQPALALEQATEILKVAPTSRDAQLLHAAALRETGGVAESAAAFDSLVPPGGLWPRARFEFGLLRFRQGATDEAARLMREALLAGAKVPNGWRILGDLCTLGGDADGADEAYNRHIASSARDPELIEAARAMVDQRVAIAERLLRGYLKRFPTDVMAIRMLAEVGARLGRYVDAELLLIRCLELAPGFAAARHNLAIVRLRLNKPEEVVRDMDVLLRSDPRHPNYRALRCAALVRLGEYEEAISSYEGLLGDYPGQSKVWMSLGHALKTVGRTQDCVTAYRRTITLKPSLGEAWWSLANLKTVRFTAADIDDMRSELAGNNLAEEDRLHLHFALGKALEDGGDYAESFRHYEQGNALGKKRVDYDEGETTLRVERSASVFTADLLRDRRGRGCLAPDPIFILGMPRAGSTLIEQILSSHSLVEGTMELPDIPAMARRLGGKVKSSEESLYPDVVSGLSGDQLRELGEEYLARTRIQRKTDRPFFVDKMPNNFAHVGLIRLILPNAKIIDARRHPLACCFSGYKQHFAQGQNFSYGLARIGAYYRDYVKLMAHFDAAEPGAVHRVIYERIVEDTESEVRSLLSYCDLEFEPACLAFHETQRPVRTASSEQVRQPIYRDGVDQWRNYEPWLGPLKDALGDVLTTYPGVPWALGVKN